MSWTIPTPECESAAGNAEMCEVLHAWLIEDLAPAHCYPDGSVFSTNLGTQVRLRGVTPTPEVIDRLAAASDAPRDAKGNVRRLALPAQFNSCEVAWGTLLRELPLRRPPSFL